MATTERHRQISETFLAHAQEEFEKGDMLQASEKAWGAVAHSVKAIARKEGWPNRSHTDVRNNARRLLNLSSDPTVNKRKFAMVEVLHINFYEEMMHPEDVLIAMADAGDLVKILNDVDSQMPR